MNIDLKNPGVQKMILAGAVGLLLVALFFFTHVLPFGFPSQSEHLRSLKAEYEKKSTELARARATVSDLPRFEMEYERLHERWISAAELLPTDRQLPALLRKITLAAQQSGVEFVVFRPNEAKVQEHYTEMPLQLSVFGGYHQVGSFVAELSNMSRIITVSNLQMKNNPNPEVPTATVSVQFTASAYSLNSSTPVDAPASPTTTTAAPQPPTQTKEGGSRARKSS
jgi:type IV pilus assembly protein PilO